MAQRGRKSAAKTPQLSSADLIDIPRAKPPADLNHYEKKVWQSVVDTKPADWFTTDTYPLLIAYCKHCNHARIIDAKIERLDPDNLRANPEADPVEIENAWLDLYDKYTRMRDRTSRDIMALARSMRLTQQSQIVPQTAGSRAQKAKSGGGSKLWEDD